MSSNDYYNDNGYQGGRQQYGGGGQQQYGGGQQQYGGGQQGYGGGQQQPYGGQQGFQGGQQPYGGGQPSYGSQQQSYGGQSQGHNNNYDDEFSSAASHAEQDSGQDRSFFSSALSFLNDRKSQLSDPSRIEVDENHAVQAHNAMYNDNDDSGRRHDSSTVGAGAAMQALKMFTSGGNNDGGMDKNKLIGMAMAQAGQLWDKKSDSGAQMEGDKQSAINNAAEMALKMYMKSQGGGIGGTGGPSGLLSLASKFL
ncbi:Uncharacterized protein PECH_001986 [Penicillium ucsense]|uniref:DUF7721 domain-containing protein n=1 Tax=Penicillium ucsense TaxID=2839758 RepID=A0A8J8VWI9_9EURO|nr:Uncharacterized protein PECM_002004 [Penicillium ucsense]KAF7731343.1 Uncharacterized protein PECH_001986 [Penicillium ucsense]